MINVKEFEFSENQKRGIGIALGLVAAAVGTGVATAVLVNRHKKKEAAYKVELLESAASEKTESEPEEEISVDFNYAKETVLTFGQCHDIAMDTAKKQYGANAYVVPASEQKALYINIEDQRRACFMFGADTTDNPEAAIRSLYHVDANTGEVFDNGGGEMKRID